MDLAPYALPTLSQLQHHGLSEPWDFQGQPGCRLTPQTAQQVAELLQWCGTGNRRVACKPADAAFLREPLWLDVSRLKQVRQYPVADFIIQVETGLTMGELAALLKPNRQAFPLQYPPELTLAEVLAEDRPALGTGLGIYPRDAVLKVEIATPDGQLTVSGADVVKNVTGYDLAKLYVSGHNAFGVITSATLKLAPLPTHRRQWRYDLPSLPEACTLGERLIKSALPLTACEIDQSAGQWRVWVELAGEDWAVVEGAGLLATLCRFTPRTLSAEEGQAALHTLQRRPLNATVVEAALPLAQWADFAMALTRQSSLEGLQLQIRPAAGLVYVNAARFPFAALRFLKNEARQSGGFMQVLQIAEADAATYSEARAVFEELNLPNDSAQRQVLQDLKRAYDPQSVLFTPNVPLMTGLSAP